MDSTTEIPGISARSNLFDRIARIREHAEKVIHSDFGEEGDAPKTLARESLEICERLERMHLEMARMVDSLEDKGDQSTQELPQDQQIDLAAVETQRETHEMRADPLDILKALLMWRDDPAERLRDRE